MLYALPSSFFGFLLFGDGFLLFGSSHWVMLEIYIKGKRPSVQLAFLHQLRGAGLFSAFITIAGHYDAQEAERAVADDVDRQPS